jgi:hypothetical protein
MPYPGNALTGDGDGGAVDTIGPRGPLGIVEGHPNPGEAVAPHIGDAGAKSGSLIMGCILSAVTVWTPAACDPFRPQAAGAACYIT